MNRKIKIKIKEKITELLKNADFFMVPVDWIRDNLSKDPELSGKLSTDMILEIVQEEKQFKIFESPNAELSSDVKAMLSQDEIKHMGFNDGPRIMLTDRIPTNTELIEFLLNKANQTFETLKKAWDIRPENNQQIEDQLLHALAKSQKLQRELREVFKEETVERSDGGG